MGKVIKIKNKDFSNNKIRKITFSETKIVSSINAIFNQGEQKIYESSTLDSLRTYLTVTANYEDQTSETVTDYTLSGTLKEGTSTITVTYGGENDTFDVIVSSTSSVSSINATYTQSGVVYKGASLDSLKKDLVVVATYSDSSTEILQGNQYTLSGTLTNSISTITVSYAGKTDTFDVTVSQQVEPEASAYCEAVGITTPSIIDKVNDFVSELKSESIWNKMESIFPFMGSDKTGMMVNLKNPTATYPQSSLVEAETGTPGSTPSLTIGEGFVNGAMNYYLNYLNSKMQSDGFSLNMRLGKATNDASLDWLSCLDGNSQGSGTGYVIFKNKSSNSIDARSNNSGFNSTSISTNILPSIFNYSMIVEQGMPIDVYVDGEKPTYLSTSGASKLDYGRNTENDNPTKLCLGYGTTLWGGNIYFFSVGEGLTGQEVAVLSNAITALKGE